MIFTPSSPNHPPVARISDPDINQVDFKFIHELEGGCRLNGYVPARKGVPLGRSGVTVACGFDIGQRDMNDLNKLGLSTPLKEKLKPYLVTRKWQAMNKIKAQPLTITQAEADEINTAVSKDRVKSLINLVGLPVWNKLDKALRTVLASLHFQYGNASKTPNPHFFSRVLSLDVNGVISSLEHFGDIYPGRRKQEAAYLKRFSSLIDKGLSKNA